MKLTHVIKLCALAVVLLALFPPYKSEAVTVGRRNGITVYEPNGLVSRGHTPIWDMVGRTTIAWDVLAIELLGIAGVGVLLARLGRSSSASDSQRDDRPAVSSPAP